MVIVGINRKIWSMNHVGLASTHVSRVRYQAFWDKLTAELLRRNPTEQAKLGGPGYA